MYNIKNENKAEQKTVTLHLGASGSIFSVQELNSRTCSRMLSTSEVSVLILVKSRPGRTTVRSTTTLALIRRRRSCDDLSAKLFRGLKSEIYILFN